MGATDRLLSSNHRYGERFDGLDLPPEPRLRVAVVACMDARFHVSKVLGLQEGDAHIIRNAGGLITDDVIRSLAISQRRLGTREIVIIHHTGCGMLGLDDDEFRRELETETGASPTWPAGGFADLEGQARRSIASVKSSPFLPHADRVRAFVYELETGLLREVVAGG